MSVYKDKKRGTYYVSISEKDSITGKRHHITKRGFKTKSEATKWERDYYSNQSAPTVTGPTFKEVVREYERTIQSSKEMQRKHKEDLEKRFSEFQDRPIESISKVDLMKWRNDLSETDFSTSTKNSAISFIKSIFKFSNEMYGTPDISSVLRRLKKNKDEILREMEVWTPEEFQTFLAMVDLREYRVFFEFLFWTGCRRGEAMALQKADVSNGWATIRYSQRTASEGLKPTKTKQLRRIKLDDKTYNDITAFMATTDSDYVFSHKGRPLSATAIDREFKRAIDKSGVKKIRIHDLRHSHATWLINNGVNIVAVSKRLGHASIEQTLKTYTHLLQETDQGMMDKINSYREVRHSGETKCGTKVNNLPENYPGVNFSKMA